MSKGGRPRIAKEIKRLPPTTVPADLEQAAKAIAEYDGVKLPTIVRKALVLYTKTRQAELNHA